MKIIILGAGQVGCLGGREPRLGSQRHHHRRPGRRRAPPSHLQERLDLRVITGNAASPSVLERAGAADADLLIAVTQSDQTNLCACRVAKTLFNVPTRIARLRAADYEDHPQLSTRHNFAVDHSICPEQIVTDPSASSSNTPRPAGARVRPRDADDDRGARLRRRPAGQQVLKTIPCGCPTSTRGSPRSSATSSPSCPPATPSSSGDEVFIIAASSHIRRVMTELRRMDQPIRRVIIAGGGNIGCASPRPSRTPSPSAHRTRPPPRASTSPPNSNAPWCCAATPPMRPSSTPRASRETDMFLALTNDEEDNIMSASSPNRWAPAAPWR